MAQKGPRRLFSKVARALVTGLMVVAVVMMVIAVLGFALIVLFFGLDDALAGGMGVSDCHEMMDSHYPGAVDTKTIAVVSESIPAPCGDCHTTEAAPFNRSGHALPATGSAPWLYGTKYDADHMIVQ